MTRHLYSTVAAVYRKLGDTTTEEVVVAYGCFYTAYGPEAVICRIYRVADANFKTVTISRADERRIEADLIKHWIAANGGIDAVKAADAKVRAERAAIADRIINGHKAV